MNLKIYFFVIFMLEMQRMEATRSNVVGRDKCQLPNTDKRLDAEGIKENYLKESSLGVIRLLKIDWTMVSDIKNDDDMKFICLCFAKTVYSPSFTSAVLTDVEYDKAYEYCTEMFSIEMLYLSPNWCLPLVKCKVVDTVFFLAESKAWYWGRKFRNMFVFELSGGEMEKLNKIGYYNVIQNPSGKFKAFYPKVDFTAYLSTFAFNIHLFW